MKKIKRPFSLIEVSIGLSLAAVLLSTLFGCFRHIVTTNAKVQKVRLENHWRYVTHLRLLQIFSSLPEKSDFTCITEELGPTLYFSFNNGADPDPNFSSTLKGELYRTKQGELTFEYVGHDGITKRGEIFKKDTSHFSLLFFNTDEKTWIPTWKEAQLPPLIQCKIDTEVFHFSLPKAHKPTVIS